jgi:hypothetical protein
LRHQQQRIIELIQRLERELESGAVAPAHRKRRLSAAGRANIVAALQKRWAAVRKAKAAKPATAPKPAVSKAAAPARRAKKVAKATGRKAGVRVKARTTKTAAAKQARRFGRQAETLLSKTGGLRAWRR